jgi:hypothetical protein
MPETLSGRKFVHRPNGDGSFDSICATCFQTVANKKIETDLNFAERTHACSTADAERAEEWLSELPKKGVHKVVEFPSRRRFRAG